MTDDSQESLTITTYDTYAESWALEHDDRFEYEVLVKKYQQLLAQGSVLEIGAGGGSDARLLTDAGYEYYGTDASAGMVAMARRSQPDLHFEQVSVYDLQRLPRTFDGFWACAVLLHVPRTRIDEALHAIGIVTKPGAIGFISMKDGTEDVFEQRQKRGRQESRLFVYWTKDAFTAALDRNGFTVVEYEYSPQSERTKWHRFFVRRDV